jgi:hypothetical protein
MSTFKLAENLQEVGAAVSLEPLQPGDPRYVEVSNGRQTTDLKLLRNYLREAAREPNRWAKLTLTGHRGCGKSTELLRMEKELDSEFFAIHLYVDQNLERDFEYTDMLLWLVDAVAERFADAKMPLDKGLIDDVVYWFANICVENVNKVKSEIEASAQAEVKAKTGLPWLSLGLLARLKSMIVGSTEHRRTIRLNLQKYGRELIDKINLVLDNAQVTLAKHKRKLQLLIVQDNLDRLPGEVSRKFYFENGDLLKLLHAHFVFTIPVAIVLAPYNIGVVFECCLNVPTIKLQEISGEPNPAGLQALVDLMAGRVAIDKVFESNTIAEELVKASGGSVRDLLRLLGYATAEAQVDNKTQIDPDSVERAIKRLRLEFERILLPGQVYYPLLARIHDTKRDAILPDESIANQQAVQDAREFFGQLLFSGAVLEYNGDEHWFDVHPTVQRSRPFLEALGKILRESYDRDLADGA